MTTNNRLLPIASLLLLTLSLPTPALIAVKTPVSQMYAGSPTVILGNITTFTPDTGILEATATTLKGDPIGDTIKLKLDNLPTLSQSIKPNQPLLLFLARRPANNALHLADTWLTPEPVPSSKSNFVVRAEKDLRQSFPGTTTALAAVVQDLKAGKNTMLDAAHPDLFKGGTKDLDNPGNLKGATALYHVNPIAGEKHENVIAAVPGGYQFFVIDSGTLRGTQEPDSAPSRLPGDIDDAVAFAGSIRSESKGSQLSVLKRTGELVVFNALDANAKEASTRLWSDPTPATAAAIGTFGEDEQSHAIVIKNNQILRYPLDGKSEPADLLRLTGERLSTYARDNPDYLAKATAQPLDANGDGRTDCLITTATGPLLLINRGHGAFFINPDLAKTLPQLTANKTLWTAADLDNDKRDDLILIQDNKVTAILNPKQEEKK